MTQPIRPKSIRNRTVVYADPLLFRPADGAESLQRYVRELDGQGADPFVLFDEEPELESLFSELPAEEVPLLRREEKEHGSKVAAFADALLADTLELAVDVDRVRTPRGARSMLRQTELRSMLAAGTERDAISSCLIAADRALTLGIEAVRVGHPRALLEDRATRIHGDNAKLAA